MSWDRVEDWLDALTELEGSELLSADGPGRREIWHETLRRVCDGLDGAQAVQGTPYSTATFVMARTVITAPIEWVALLLGHGTAVTLKHPHGLPGASPQLVAAAERVGLPLTATDDRAAVLGADLVIAMGSDETMSAIDAALRPEQDRLLFGHRFSAAWAEADADWIDAADAIWPFDSRGCLSPQVVFTTLPLDVAVPKMAAALEAETKRHPRGLIGRAEGARIRARGALARITGVDRTTGDWAVHGLLAEHWYPEALPHCVAVIHVPNRAAARAVLHPWSRWLSTVGDADADSWFDARVCPIRQMQRPPLDRSHDGVDVLRAVVRGR